MSNAQVATPNVTGELQEIIAKQAVLAFNQGYQQANREVARDIFDEVLAILSNLYDDYQRYPSQQEAISDAQARIEALQERVASQ